MILINCYFLAGVECQTQTIRKPSSLHSVLLNGIGKSMETLKNTHLDTNTDNENPNSTMELFDDHNDSIQILNSKSADDKVKVTGIQFYDKTPLQWKPSECNHLREFDELPCGNTKTFQVRQSLVS